MSSDNVVESTPTADSSTSSTTLKIMSRRKRLRVTPARSATRTAVGNQEEESMDKEESEEYLAETDPEVQEFVQETGCPIYGTEKLSPELVASFLLNPEAIEQDKICFRIPPSCPGRGIWMFIISLEHVDPDDISCDLLGKYHKPSGRKHYFQMTTEQIRKVPEKQTDRTAFDYVVRANRYTHSDPEKGNQFHKLTFLAYNRENDLMGPYGIIQYLANVDPSSLLHIAHSNAKSDKPLMRTKPSAIKQAKTLLLTQTPREVIETMSAAQTISGEHDPTEMPRGLASVSTMVHRTPGAMRAPRGRPKATQRLSRSYYEPVEEMEYEEDLSGRNQSYPGLSKVSTSRPKIDALQVQVLAAEKRKHEMEMEKIEMEKDKMELERERMEMEKEKLMAERDKYMTEREKLEYECEMIKAGTSKLHMEMEMMKTKRHRMDLDINKMSNEDENVVVVHDEMAYNSSFQ